MHEREGLTRDVGDEMIAPVNDALPIQCSPEVDRALSERLPIVALESTIISHGMPYPANAHTARSVEGDVRSNGAVPATIAIIDGAIRVGLDEAQIERLATTGEVAKASRRDIGAILATRRTAATTVAATMIAAHAAGISVFATGGTGGVHRGAEVTWDVSADLVELQRTPVAVVGAGCKSILDIGKTLEYLETLGVPVITIGQDQFPAFYARTSGFDTPLRVDDITILADAIAGHWRLPHAGGVLVANPIPPDAGIDHDEIEQLIRRALQSADRRGITGRDVTPFVLDRIVEISGGRSLEANLALVRNNARVAARLAVALHNGQLT